VLSSSDDRWLIIACNMPNGRKPCRHRAKDYRLDGKSKMLVELTCTCEGKSECRSHLMHIVRRDEKRELRRIDTARTFEAVHRCFFGYSIDRSCFLGTRRRLANGPLSLCGSFASYFNIPVPQYRGSCSVVVITFPLHGKGPAFEPRHELQCKAFIFVPIACELTEISRFFVEEHIHDS
jgi:hypothetical protein